MKFFTASPTRQIAEQARARIKFVADTEFESLAHFAAALAITYGGTARGFE